MYIPYRSHGHPKLQGAAEPEYLYALLLFQAHGRVHVSEDIKLYQDGEDKEDCIGHQADSPDPLIQLPAPPDARNKSERETK